MLNQLRRSNTFYQARYLRRKMTLPEKILWLFLRKRKIAPFKFRRQAPIGKYIADFLCIELKIIIEIDGDSHTAQEIYDAQRTQWLEKHGYCVIRIANEEILSGSEKPYKKILAICEKLSR